MNFIKHSIAAAALLATSMSALAGLSVGSAIPAGQTLLSDDSAEQWIDVDGDGELSVGDKLRGILTINQAGHNPVTLIGGNTAYNELTGIFQTVVTDVTPLSPLTSNFTFAADPDFATEFGVAAGTVGMFFEDSANNFARQNCGGANDYAACEATATDGSLWATFGLAGGFWSAANAANNPALGASLPLATPLGTFGVGLNFMVNNTGYDWNKVTCIDTTTFVAYAVDFCGQGGILATGRDLGAADTPYELFDNVDFTVNRIPEPASIALVGLALAGMGAAARRSKKQ